MKIDKVMNNNVVSSIDEDGQEIIVVGTGIGFQGKEGKVVDEKKIQKIFRLEDPKMIRKLKEKGYVIALASSKPETACRRILEHFSLTSYFDMIVGSTLDGRISTKQEVLEELGRRMEHLNIPKEEMCLIGDTAYDVVGANQFGIRCVGVTYGFGTREQLQKAGAYRICDSVEEIGKLFL